MSGDVRLVLSAVLGIAAAIVLIVRARFHPFLALLCGAFLVGLLDGLPMADTAKAVQKGAGDVLGGTGLVVALGLSLGAMLQLSDGAGALARAALRLTRPAAAPWASMAVALLVGLPLFFETGVSQTSATRCWRWSSPTSPRCRCCSAGAWAKVPSRPASGPRR